MLRSAVVVHSAVRGGAEKYLRELYNGSTIDGYVIGSQPDWASFVDPRFGPKWGGPRSILTGRLRLAAEKRRLAAALDEAAFDIAHVQFKREQIGFTGMLSSKMPVVWTEHGVMSDRTRALLGRGYSKAAERAAIIICVSEEVAEAVQSISPRARTIVIENCVDTSSHSVPSARARQAARRRLGLTDDERVAIWVGRMDANKRPDLAARIGYGWEGSLLIAGDGVLRSTIVDRDGVRTLGHINPVSLYDAADVMLMTSNGIGEGMPYALLEAAAHGVPAVVSSQVPLLARLAAEAGGVSVQDTKVGDWHAALSSAATDAGRRMRARSWAVDHDVETWRRRHVDAIKAAI